MRLVSFPTSTGDTFINVDKVMFLKQFGDDETLIILDGGAEIVVIGQFNDVARVISERNTASFAKECQRFAAEVAVNL